MDYNFYRKVSKYDLDKLCVDWTEYQKERERQNTINAAHKKDNQNKETEMKKQKEAEAKMKRIEEAQKNRERSLKENKAMA